MVNDWYWTWLAISAVMVTCGVLIISVFCHWLLHMDPDKR